MIDDISWECWKRLIDAGVKLDYALVPSGDRQVPIKLGLSVPFSYTTVRSSASPPVVPQ